MKKVTMRNDFIIGQSLESRILEKSTRPNISYAVNQCARFTHDPKKRSNHSFSKLSKKTKDCGSTLKSYQENSLEFYVDTDFCGNWYRLTSEEDAITAKSRTGYIITFMGYAITWNSKLQTQIALSTTEAEYIAMSMAMREVIFQSQIY